MSANLPKSNAGFTLFEILVSSAVMAITLSIVTFTFFSVRQKSILQQEVDEVVAMLEFARQQSISAYLGESYQVDFQEDIVRITPGNKFRRLNDDLEVSLEPNSSSISFAQLSGRPDSAYTVNLVWGNLIGQVLVDETGLISQLPIKQK